MIKSVLNRAHRAISTSKVFAHESLVEVESVVQIARLKEEAIVKAKANQVVMFEEREILYKFNMGDVKLITVSEGKVRAVPRL